MTASRLRCHLSTRRRAIPHGGKHMTAKSSLIALMFLALPSAGASQAPVAERAVAECDISRSHDAAPGRQGDSDSLFRPCAYQGGQHPLCPAGPDCLYERGFL